MSTDSGGEPVRHTDDDVLGRLAAIDHRLHQISTQLATMGQLLSQLEQIGANLETLIGSLSGTAQ
jgi:flagellin-like hook-associated protein FlgL